MCNHTDPKKGWKYFDLDLSEKAVYTTILTKKVDKKNNASRLFRAGLYTVVCNDVSDARIMQHDHILITDFRTFLSI